jgi:hypothetical protein
VTSACAECKLECIVEAGIAVSLHGFRRFLPQFRSKPALGQGLHGGCRHLTPGFADDAHQELPRFR